MPGASPRPPPPLSFRTSNCISGSLATLCSSGVLVPSQPVMAGAKATAGPRYTAPQAVHYSAPGSSAQRECEWLAGAGPAQCPPPCLANISHSPWGTCSGLCSFAEHSQASWTPVSPTTEALDVFLCELHKNERIFERVISQ